jgi:anti-sigma-K factor RskA
VNIEEYISSGILESYILGLASPEEAGILECVMKNSAEVRAAFEEAQKTLEDLATAQAIKPPEELETKIWAKIQAEQIVEKTQPLTIENTAPRIEKSPQKVYQDQSSSWKRYAVAASVLFLVSILGNLFYLNNSSKTQKEIAKLQTERQSQNLALQTSQEKLSILTNPNIVTVPLKGVEKHPQSQAMVYWDNASKDVYLNAQNLPKAPEGMQYQLWAIVDGKPVSAGMYSADKDTRIILSNIPKAQAFAITLEKQGGSDAPTMENMFVMGTV